MRTLEQQIRSTEFTVSRKGYDPTAVDEALEGFADGAAALLAELRKESIRVSALERSLTFAQGGGPTSQPDLGALVLEASERREHLIEEAHATAAAIIAKARVQAAQQDTDGAASSDPGEPLDGTRQVELALEEARAIESAARDVAERIRADAEADAERVLSSARAAVNRLEAVDTGTGGTGVELAQQYGSGSIP